MSSIRHVPPAASKQVIGQSLARPPVLFPGIDYEQEQDHDYELLMVYDKRSVGVIMSQCIFCKKNHDFDTEESFQILRKTSDTLRLLLDDASPEAFSKRNNDAWSPREILIHMVDTEFAYGFRYRYIMAEKEPVITPFDQNDWVKTFDYGNLDATQLVRAFTPLRRVNLELLQNVDPKLFDKQAHHPQYGMITVGMMIPHLAAHDLGHLQQIRDRLPVL